MRLDPLTLGLHRHFLTTSPRWPGFLRRLKQIGKAYDDEFVHHDVLLSPVLAHRTPELGWLHPTVPFDELRERLVNYVGFTPLQNVAGAPAVALPGGRTQDGLPIGVQLAGATGDERNTDRARLPPRGREAVARGDRCTRIGRVVTTQARSSLRSSSISEFETEAPRPGESAEAVARGAGIARRPTF